jgi:predicted amidophosphoribosyltransferase
MQSWISDFVNLFYPETCMGCEHSLQTGEEMLCVSCRSQLPVAYHDLRDNDKMVELFYARVPLEHVTSLLYYEKIGTVQHLIHELKYKKQEQIGDFLGKWLSSYMASDNRFKDVDLVIPVPVHPKRLRKEAIIRLQNSVNVLQMGWEFAFAKACSLKIRTQKSRLN